MSKLVLKIGQIWQVPESLLNYVITDITNGLIKYEGLILSLPGICMSTSMGGTVPEEMFLTWIKKKDVKLVTSTIANFIEDLNNKIEYLINDTCWNGEFPK